MAINFKFWLNGQDDISRVMTKTIAIKYIPFKQMIRIKWEKYLIPLKGLDNTRKKERKGKINRKQKKKKNQISY